MSAISSQGVLSLPLEHLKTLLAASSTWQTWTGAADATEALASIHLHALDLEGDTATERTEFVKDARPFAIVSHVPAAGFEATRIAGGGQMSFHTEGTLMLAIEANIAAEDADDTREAEVTFSNNLGGVIADMMALAGKVVGATAYLLVQGIRVVEGPMRSSEDEQILAGDYHFAVLEIDWGI